jgi:hypothetical protein
LAHDLFSLLSLVLRELGLSANDLIQYFTEVLQGPGRKGSLPQASAGYCFS